MFVTAHAINRLTARLGHARADYLREYLESMDGEHGTVAYVVATLPVKVTALDGSNGDVLVCVAVDGSVETVYFRRSNQDMSPAYFGAKRVVDLRAHPVGGGRPRA